MPFARCNASALCVNQAPDIVLVVGGYCKDAELLYVDASQEGQQWQWRKLSSMHNMRVKPGVLLLSDIGDTKRVLVAGGWENTAELLTVRCTNTGDRGQWTLIAPLSTSFNTTSLVCFNTRILAFGRFYVFF